MFNTFAIKAINLLLKANPQTQTKLKSLATKLVELKLPFMTLNFIIAPDGSLEAEDSAAPDCSIEIPFGSSSHLIHQDQLKTFQSIAIEGDKVLAKELMTILATLDASNVLYLHESPILGMFAVKLEKLLQGLVDYAKLVTQNAGLSTSQYVQHEAQIIADKYQIDDFCNQVDELKERTDLLTKRIERIN